MTIKIRFIACTVGRRDPTGPAPPARLATIAPAPVADTERRIAWTPRPSPGAYALLAGAVRLS